MESRRIMDFLLLIFTCIIPPSLTQDRITVFLWLLIVILKLAIFFFLYCQTHARKYSSSPKSTQSCNVNV